MVALLEHLANEGNTSDFLIMRASGKPSIDKFGEVVNHLREFYDKELCSLFDRILAME